MSEEKRVLTSHEPTEVGSGTLAGSALQVISGRRARRTHCTGMGLTWAGFKGCTFSTFSGLVCYKGPPSRAAGAPCGTPRPTMEP